MSKLLQLINHLKMQVNESMLTPTQQMTLTSILHAWRSPKRLNLAGPVGSGKTFMGWVLAKQHGATFYSSPRRFKADTINKSNIVIIDQVPFDELSQRELLAEIQLRQISRTLFISPRPLPGGWTKIELASPTPADLVWVQQQWTQWLLPTAPLDQPHNFWQLLTSTL